MIAAPLVAHDRHVSGLTELLYVQGKTSHYEMLWSDKRKGVEGTTEFGGEPAQTGFPFGSIRIDSGEIEKGLPGYWEENHP